MISRDHAVRVVAEVLHGLGCADDECDGGDLGGYEADSEAVIDALDAEIWSNRMIESERFLRRHRESLKSLGALLGIEAGVALSRDKNVRK